MNKNNIVTINGRAYDAHTGVPVEPSTTQKSSSAKKPISAGLMHSSVQKSQTLHRRSTKKPVTTRIMQPVRAVGRSMDIARSKSISRFAPHPIVKPLPQSGEPKTDIAAVLHPSVVKAHAKHLAKQRAKTPTAITKTPKAIKDEAIAAALATPAVTSKKVRFLKRHKRFVNVLSGSLVLLLVAAFVTYVNLPSLSVRIAAAQAGIGATYPDYHPDGYSLNGPVTFADGKVTMTFTANTGTRQFTIIQSKSSWDSSALQAQVDKESSGQFITTQQQGLTIYTYASNAAWVNGGILYKIRSNGDVVLSGDQIRQIATSM